ncbi:Fructosamine-3-kinase [Lamellibrachia satsuma]|nr:Fructosamine-3-kinase [Lamellibrachia satsuma]
MTYWDYSLIRKTKKKVNKIEPKCWNKTAVIMLELIKKELKTKTLKKFGSGGGGCINNGQGYITDSNSKIFVKTNDKSGARLMFDGEAASLDAILATKAIKVPSPIKVLDNPAGGAVLVMEYIEIKPLRRFSAQLGDQLARMHLHNEELAIRDGKLSSLAGDSGEEHVDKFGFHTTTCCGYLAQDNTWTDDWVTFFCQNKLQPQLDLIEKDYHDSEARTLWVQLLPRIPKFFSGIEVRPALLHGDLWGGNIGETDSGPVIFDPSSFYGHHEYELGIATMFGGFDSAFFNAYHKLIPRAPGFNTRQKLYQLFNYLNHWNHFGTGYRGSSIGLMKSLIKE